MERLQPRSQITFFDDCSKGESSRCTSSSINKRQWSGARTLFPGEADPRFGRVLTGAYVLSEAAFAMNLGFSHSRAQSLHPEWGMVESHGTFTSTVPANSSKLLT